MPPDHPGEGLALTTFSPKSDFIVIITPPWVGSTYLCHNAMFGRERFTVTLRVLLAWETVSF